VKHSIITICLIFILLTFKRWRGGGENIKNKLTIANIEKAAKKLLAIRGKVNIIFEHEQYFIQTESSLWSVSEAEGIGTYNGISFEHIEDYEN
jgi:hypothetical protein